MPVTSDKTKITGQCQQTVILGKAAIAELTESVMLRICKVMSGGSYSRHSTYGYWLEDVRALGFTTTLAIIERLSCIPTPTGRQELRSI